jgi:hypothetical protein
MQPFVVGAIRAITQSLQSAPLTLDADAATASRTRQEFELDVSAAEALAGGSLIFPNPQDSLDFDWCIFRLIAVDRRRRVRIFQLGARLYATLNSVHFVSGAYEHILRRPIDEDGRSIYPSLIDGLKLSKRDTLKKIADSPEARSLKTTLLIVPHPSVWFAALSLDDDGDASFPLVVTRM